MIDYHLHTFFCNHAKSSMETYILSAIKMGLQEICFLDHLILHDSGKKSSMTIDEVPLYLNAIRHLKHKYHDKITIKSGLEVDFDQKNIGLIQEITKKFDFDVIGSSVHFVGKYNVASKRAFSKYKFKNFDRIYENYLEKLDKMLDYKYFDFICHLDIIKKHNINISENLKNKIDKYYDSILTKIGYKKLIVEVNTSGINHSVKEMYPSINLIKKCFEKNINITIGSDAHNKESIGQYFDTATESLFSVGYKSVCGFTQRKFYTISLKN